MQKRNLCKNVQNMKPVQYALVSYVAHISRFFFKFEINEYFHFFRGGGGGVGVGMGGCGGGDIRRFY